MKILKLLMLALLIATPLLAQNEPIQLPKVNVTSDSVTGELRFDNNVGDSAFADGANFLNTPRSVSTVDSTIFEKYHLATIGSIQSYVSNVQTVGSFGQSATVNIRGDLSEQYVNNQRRTNNSFGFQPSLNAVEAVDLVHGAPSVVFGPGFYSGGYVNFQMKQAEFKEFTNTKLTIGTYAPNGNSFLNTSFQYDQNIPVNDDEAIRISYEGKKNDTFYHRNGAREDAEDFYFTYHKFSDNVTFDLYTDYSCQAAPELIGVNRITQDLIWNNNYRTGTIPVPYDTTAVANGSLVKLPATSILFSNGDFSNANVFFAQGILVERLYDSVFLKNYTMAEYINRRRFNAYEYTEYAKQFTLDNRTEFHFDKLNNSSYTIIGLEERYEERKAEVNYTNTYFNAFDATNGTNHASLNYPDYAHGIVDMGGREFFGTDAYTFDTTHSKLLSVSPFLQQRIYAGNFQFLYGFRSDSYRVSVEDPLNSANHDSVTTTTFGNTESLIYSLTDKWSVYATYGRLRAVNGSVTGGGIVLDPDLKVNKDSLRSLNKLYEVGTRWNTLNASVGLTAFWQYRQQHNFYVNEPDNILARGIELETKFQPTRDLFFITNLTYMEANYDNSLPFEFSGNGLPAASIAGNYRISGLSRLYFNSTIAKTIAKNWGISTTLRAQSEQAGDTLGNYHIPSQYSLDVQLSYVEKNWSAALYFNNVTNQLNWVHNGDAYGANVIISRELPFNIGATFTRKF